MSDAVLHSAGDAIQPAAAVLGDGRLPPADVPGGPGQGAGAAGDQPRRRRGGVPHGGGDGDRTDNAVVQREAARRKYTDYVFTLNHWTPEERDALKTRATAGSNNLVYVGFAEETGESGTPHLQGLAIFRTPCTLAIAKLAISLRAHLEPRRGTRQEARDYFADPQPPKPPVAGLFESCELPTGDLELCYLRNAWLTYASGYRA